MECTTCRTTLSARLDGEEDETPGAAVDRHLATCADCRAWLDAAVSLNRAVRITPADVVPDLSGAILAAAPPVPARRRATDWRLVPWQAGLLSVAAVQLLVALPGLILGDGAGLPVHAAHEIGSFDAALAVGLLFAAARPNRAAALLPLVAALVAFLVATTAVDVIDGRTHWLAEGAHLLEVVGLAMLWRVAQLVRPSTRRSLAV
jgi:predicted anti-sigma-YlaC factor YlaD